MRMYEELATNKKHSRSKQNADVSSSISETFILKVVFVRYVVMHIVKQEMVKSLRQYNTYMYTYTVQHNTTLITTFL